jgi:hypothetical protein
MKFRLELIVNTPLDRLLELFGEPDNLKKWQPGIVNFELLKGEFGEVGTKAKLKMNVLGKKIDLFETILKNNLPDEYILQYDSPGVTNTVNNSFKAISPNQTQWIMFNEFKFSGLMKFAGAAMKGVFKKQTELTMNRFKNFAEELPK